MLHRSLPQAVDQDRVATIEEASWKFVSILASFCVWTKSLMCKDAVNRDSTCQSIFRRLCTAKKIEDFRLPVSRPEDVFDVVFCLPKYINNK
jgi:hypothetical protein